MICERIRPFLFLLCLLPCVLFSSISTQQQQQQNGQNQFRIYQNITLSFGLGLTNHSLQRGNQQQCSLQPYGGGTDLQSTYRRTAVPSR
jgi:hypothetical protein